MNSGTRILALFALFLVGFAIGSYLGYTGHDYGRTPLETAIKDMQENGTDGRGASLLTRGFVFGLIGALVTTGAGYALILLSERKAPA